MDEPSDADYLLARHLRPMPRVLQGGRCVTGDIGYRSLRRPDLRSGPYSQSQRLRRTYRSRCHAVLRCDAARVDSEQALRWALAGGEDYELCFTVPELNRGALDVALGHLGARFTCIGQIAPESEGLQFIRDGKPVALDLKGYDHFA